jgi:hypothetical protein
MWPSMDILLVPLAATQAITTKWSDGVNPESVDATIVE